MAGRDPVEVTVEADGREVTAGTLWIHDRGGQSATFRYAGSYLADPGSDDTRQGAIRFRQPGASGYYSVHRHAVPRLIEVARLLRAADRLREDGGFDRDIADLIDAGSSLGGARPKAAVMSSSGRLTIAKFPRSGSDEWDAPGRLVAVSGLRPEPQPGQSGAPEHDHRPRRRHRKHGCRARGVRRLSPLPYCRARADR